MTKNPPLHEAVAWLEKLMADKGIPNIASLAREVGKPNTTFSRPMKRRSAGHRISLPVLRSVADHYNYPMPDHWRGEQSPTLTDKRMEAAVEWAVAVAGDDKTRLPELIRLAHSILVKLNLK